METLVNPDSTRTRNLVAILAVLLCVHCSSSAGVQSHPGQRDGDACSAGGGCGSCPADGLACSDDAGSDTRPPTDSGPSHDGISPGDGPTSKDSPTGDAGMPVMIVPAFYVSTTGMDSNPGSDRPPATTLSWLRSMMPWSSSAGASSRPTSRTPGAGTARPGRRSESRGRRRAGRPRWLD